MFGNKKVVVEKTFCLDCGIRVKPDELMNKLFGGKNESVRSPIEYREGWRCADCAEKQKKYGGMIAKN